MTWRLRQNLEGFLGDNISKKRRSSLWEDLLGGLIELYVMWSCFCGVPVLECHASFVGQGSEVASLRRVLGLSE